MEDAFLHGLLRILEPLLRSRNERAAVRAAEIVGLLALKSERINHHVAACNELLVPLVQLIASGNCSVSRAAVNAVGDLGITAASRRALQECDVINYILRLLVSLSDLLDPDVEEDFVDALRVLDDLLFQHSEVTFQRVPKDLALTTYSKLRGVWKDLLKEEDEDDEEEDHKLTSTRYLVARLLSFLGLEVLPLEPSGSVHSHVFAGEEFIEKNWEKLPVVTNRTGSLLEALQRELRAQDSSQVIKALVGYSVSCPPVSSDQLDPGELFREIQADLGKPLIYQQDIRLVKCEQGDGIEQHYISEKSSNEQVVRIEDCLRAFNLGYTVAIRGIEFRSRLVADIAHSLCLQLGQASVGANIYLTPPNAQGLVLHYDDHCVFVVQVSGEKRWTVSPAPTVVLPRLYAPRLAPEIPSHDLVEMFLTEGSVLYIPRGFAHQASTAESDQLSRIPGRGKRKRSLETNNRHPTTSEFSLHLTFGVEVELPFEWLGFIHIALHFWSIQTKLTENQDGRLSKMFLHLTLSSMADNVLVELRKACTVAMPGKEVSQTKDDSTHQYTFKELITKIASHANYSNTTIKADEYAASLSWLAHLPGTEGLETDLKLATANETEFSEMYLKARDSFLERALYDESVFLKAREFFLLLLQSYRTSRRKLINGMLALHSISED